MGIDAGSDSFEKEVLESDRPVLVDFWGPRCGPCLALMGAVEELEMKYREKTKLVKIDASQNKRLCLRLKVLGLPTYLFFKGGKEVDRIAGQGVGIEDIESSLKHMIE